MEQTLGKRIAEHRKRLKLTQDQLAEKLGVTAQAVSKWENDQSCPDIGTLPKLAEIFSISTDELLGHAEPKQVFKGEVLENDADEPDGIHLQKDNWEFHWDSGRWSALGFAIWVLGVGALYLTSQLLRTDIDLWSILWPSAIFMLGFWTLFKRFSFFSIGCTLLGGYILADKFFVFPFTLGGKLVWALLILILGLSLLANALKRPKKPKFSIFHNTNPHKNTNEHHSRSEYTTTGDAFSCTCTFSNTSEIVTMDTLQHGNISVAFGDCTIDLREVKSVTPDCTLRASCSFGELRLRIPKCYRIIPEHSKCFADWHISGSPDAEPQGDIRLIGSVSFGEISIKYV